MLQSGDRVPHFSVTAINGVRVDYSSIWQRRNLVLLCLPDAEGERVAPEALALASRARDVAQDDPDTAVIVTTDAVPGVASPGVLVADRWGEVYFAAGGDDRLPDPDQLIEWLRTVQHECPECQGEAW